MAPTPTLTIPRLLLAEPLRIVPRPGIIPADHPRQSDFQFFRADGSEWIGKAFSPSAVVTFCECQRKWAWRALDRKNVPAKPAAALGTATHAELDSWLSRSIPPTSPLLVDSGALAHFPMPRTPGLVAEGQFAFRIVVAGLAGQEYSAGLAGLEYLFWGRKDVEIRTMPPAVMDLKTTKDLIWAKTPQELLEDLQAAVYGWDTMLRAHCDVVDLKWVYTQTQKARVCKPVPVHLELAQAEKVVLAKVPACKEILGILSQGLTAIQLPATTGACSAYGGCEFRDFCTDTKPGAAGYMSRLKQTRLEGARREARPDTTVARLGVTETKKMASILEKALAAAKAKGPVAQTQAVAAAAAAPTVEVMTGKVTPAPTPAEPTVDTSKAEQMGVVLPETLGVRSVTVAPRSDGMWVGKDETGVIERVATSKDGARDVVKMAILTEIRAAQKAAAAPPKLQVDVEASVATGKTVVVSVPASEPAPVAGTVAEPPKKRPGRAKKDAATAPASVSGPFDLGFTLLVDVLPVRGVTATEADQLWAHAREEVERLEGVDWRLIEYGKGSAYIAAQMAEDMKTDAPVGTFFVSSRTCPKEVLEELMRRADVVLKGVI